MVDLAGVDSIAELDHPGHAARLLPVAQVMGIDICRIDRFEALDTIELLGLSGRTGFIAFANAHTLNLSYDDPRFADVLRKADLVLNDGTGVSLAGRLRRTKFPDNLNGTDLTPEILRRASERGWSVFFLGGSKGVAAKAAHQLADRVPGLKVAGTLDGMFPAWTEMEVAAAVAASKADVLLVAMGNPLQEMFIARNLPVLGTRLAIGVGGFFDFEAKRIPRAPQWIVDTGFEWMFRLLQEPKRLWRRYLVGNPVFLARVVSDLWASRATAHDDGPGPQVLDLRDAT